MRTLQGAHVPMETFSIQNVFLYTCYGVQPVLSHVLIQNEINCTCRVIDRASGVSKEAARDVAHPAGGIGGVPVGPRGGPGSVGARGGGCAGVGGAGGGGAGGGGGHAGRGHAGRGGAGGGAVGRAKDGTAEWGRRGHGPHQPQRLCEIEAADGGGRAWALAGGAATTAEAARAGGPGDADGVVWGATGRGGGRHANGQSIDTIPP
jgi:hypothetical protein